MNGHLERLRVYLEVVEKGGFAAAARSLGLTPTQATRHVSELEAELGLRLLTRTTRKVAPTSAGRLYAERAKPLVDDLLCAEEAVRQQEQTLKGGLRVSVPMSFSLRFLPDAISQFRILYPDLRLTLDLSDRLVDVMREGFDMALRISGPPKDISLVWRKIMPAPRALVASKAYLERRGRPSRPQDLSGHDALVYAHGVEDARWTFEDRATGEFLTVALPSCFRANNGDLLAELALRGEGVALLPRFIVDAALKNGSLVELLEDWRLEDLWLAAIYPPYDHLPAKVKTFTDFVEAAAKAGATPLG